jgi:hypothetical protein
MALPELADDLIERIKGAAPGVSDTALGRELGIHRITVWKYRRLAKQERQEIAREVIAQHVEANIPDALADLADLRLTAKQAYKSSGDARDGSLWLNAIKTTLEYVTPDDATLDAAIEQELGLAQAADEAEAPLSRTAARAERARVVC